MKHEDKILWDWDIVIIVAIILVFLLGWLTSCNTVHKLYDKNRVGIDSNVTYTMSTNKDSTVSSSKSNYNDSVINRFVRIVFGRDTNYNKLPQTPVIVKIDSAGTYVITPGNRPVASVTINSYDSKTTKVDSTKKLVDKGFRKDTTTQKLKREKTIISKSKVSKRFPLSIVAGIVAFLILIGVGIYLKKSLNKI